MAASIDKRQYRVKTPRGKVVPDPRGASVAVCWALVHARPTVMLFTPRLCHIPATAAALAALDVHLGAGEVLVVCMQLDRSVQLPDALLSTTEHQRMARFRFAADRQRYLVAHAAKRLLLGRMLGQPAAELGFTTGAYGKPALLSGKLNFSLSHSGDWVALALRRDMSVGVDVQQYRSGTDHAAVMAAIAHPDDRPGASASEPERFYRLWTLKEAAAKCDGRGLALGLSRLAVQPAMASGWFVCTGEEDAWACWHTLLAPDVQLAVACGC